MRAGSNSVTGVLTGGGDLDTHQGKTACGQGEKVAVCKPGREAPEETKPAQDLISDFQPPDCKERSVCGTFSRKPGQTNVSAYWLHRQPLLGKVLLSVIPE